MLLGIFAIIKKAFKNFKTTKGEAIHEVILSFDINYDGELLVWQSVIISVCIVSLNLLQRVLEVDRGGLFDVYDHHFFH